VRADDQQRTIDPLALNEGRPCRLRPRPRQPSRRTPGVHRRVTLPRQERRCAAKYLHLRWMSDVRGRGHIEGQVTVTAGLDGQVRR
jgi:hypothetical protein